MTFQALAVIGDATQTDSFIDSTRRMNEVLAKVENLKQDDTDGGRN
jgi:hypothetical protein